MSCAVSSEMPEAARCAGLYPDIIPSEAVTGSLQKGTQYIQDLSVTKDKEGMVTVCDKSGLRPGVGTVGLLQRTEASHAVTVLPADLGDRPAGLVDHAQSLEACQSRVKLEDSGLAHRSCRREEHVAAADGDAGPGAHSAGQGHGEGRAAVRLDTALAAPSAAVLPVPPGQVSPKAWDTRAAFVTEPPAGRSSCDPDSQEQVLPSRQQKKKKKKKKLPLAGAQLSARGSVCP